MATQSSAARARTGGNPFLRFVNGMSMVAGWTAAAMILASVLITCQMIFVRFVLNQSTVWQTEAVIYLMVASTMIGLSYVQHMRGHVNVDLIPLALGPRGRFWLAMVTMGLSIAVVAVLFWYAYDFWHLAWSRGWKSETVWAVRLWIPYLAIPVGFGLLLLQLIADLVALITGADKPFGLETS
ncbi:MAG: TRAP transporter small permease [Rhodobacteraceae bacterium]|nr:MAG: TRAP transporter small permease [Paracoccaceae bacterium]